MAKPAPERKRISSDRLDKALQVRYFLLERIAGSNKLAQKWQVNEVNASARTVRRRFFNKGLAARRAAKKPILTPKNITDRLAFCRKYKD